MSSVGSLAGFIAIVGLAGCGGLPPAAEPATPPPLTASPAGRVVRVGALPEGVVDEPAAGVIAVAVRNPAGVVLVDSRTLRIVRRIPLPGAARHLSLDGRSVLVPAERSDELFVVGLPRGPVTTVRVGSFPTGRGAGVLEAIDPTT